MAWLRKRGSTWYLCERLGQKERQRPVGPNETKARAILAAGEDARQGGMTPEDIAVYYESLAKEIREDARPLDDLLDVFLDAKRSEEKAAATVDYYRLYCGRFVQAWKRRPWRAMTPAQLRKWLLEQNNRPSATRALKAFGRFCQAENLWLDNPLQYLKGGQTRSRRVRATEKELNGFEKKLQGTRLYLPFLLLRYLGLRVSEVCFARMEHLDVRNRLLLITHWEADELSPRWQEVRHVEFDRKNRQAKMYYLHEKVIAALAEEPDKKREWVCLNTRGRRWRRNVLYRALKDATGYHPHAYRHTFVSRVLATGGSAAVARELAGHSTIAVTDGYADAFPDELKKAIDRL